MLIARATELRAEALGKQGMPLGCRMHCIPEEGRRAVRTTRAKGGWYARRRHVRQTVIRRLRYQILHKLGYWFSIIIAITV